MYKQTCKSFSLCLRKEKIDAGIENGKNMPLIYVIKEGGGIIFINFRSCGQFHNSNFHDLIEKKFSKRKPIFVMMKLKVP